MIPKECVGPRGQICFFTDAQLRGATYQELLLDGRWQSRSYRIKERDNFICQADGCERKRDLEVHHKKYTTPLPWDEPGENLITLCAICHHAAGREKFNGSIPSQIKELVGSLVKSEPKPVHRESDKHLQAQIERARNYHYGT